MMLWSPWQFVLTDVTLAPSLPEQSLLVITSRSSFVTEPRLEFLEDNSLMLGCFESSHESSPRELWLSKAELETLYPRRVGEASIVQSSSASSGRCRQQARL